MRRSTWLLVFLLAVTVINYPNPFNPKGGQSTTIECTGTTTADAYLYIYDMGAKLVMRKAFNLTGGATNRSTWNGYGDNNLQVGNGIYLYQVIDANRSRVGKGKIWVINQ